MASTLFGIDPGNNGGIVLFQHRGGGWSLERCFKLEHGEQAIVDFVRETALDASDSVAFLEKVLGWGVARSFNFGKYYGFVRACFMMRGIPIVDVQPQVWMKQAGVTGKSQTKEKRQSMRQLAERRLEETGQELGVTNWNAAAVLIGYYGISTQVYENDDHAVIF